MHATHIDRRTRPKWLEIDYWTASDGWPLRRFRVAPAAGATPRGSLIFQTGRADFIEKYIESFDHWRQLGWSIEGFDWRGQGGSGRMLEDPRVGHGPPYADMVSDLDAYCAEWLARSQPPHVMIGHSMGGHLVLRMLAGTQVPSVDGAILLSPMLGLNAGWIGEGIGRTIARLLCRIGFSKRPAWSEDAKGSGHRQRNLTHSEERYADEQWWRGEDERLDVGPPSWGWLRDSWESSIGLLRPSVLENARTPLLMLCAEHDQLVTPDAMKRAARMLPNARLMCHPAAAHELLREIDPIRLWALAAIDEFLASIGKAK